MTIKLFNENSFKQENINQTQTNLNYSPLLNNILINGLNYINKSKDIIKTEKVTQLNEPVLILQRNDLETLLLIMNADKSFNIPAYTHKLLDFCLLELTKTNSKKSSNLNLDVTFTTDKFMQMCNLKNTTKNKSLIRKKIIDVINAIADYKLKSHTIISMAILGSATYEKGVYKLKFYDEFVKLLIETNYISMYPLNLLKLKDGSNEYFIGKKLALHYGNNKNLARNRHNILSVKKVIENSNLSLNDTNKRRNRKQDIINPTIKSLNILLESILESWSFCKEKKVALSDFELEKAKNDFNFFMSLYITFEFKDYPKREPALRKKYIKKNI